MTENLVGACVDHPNPDWWYPEFHNGRPTNKKVRSLISNTKTALAICSTCPIKDKCLEMGMSEKDLPHGIWGGILAGERIILAGKANKKYGEQTDLGRALSFYSRIKPLLE